MSANVTARVLPSPLRRIWGLVSTALNLVRNPSHPLLYFTARANMPRLCAAIALLFIQRVRLPATPGAVTKRFLVLNKSVFIEDVQAIAEQIDGAELFLLGRTQLHFIAKAFFRDGTNDNNYHDMADERIVQRYRVFLSTFWAHLRQRAGIICALSGNFSYYEERELAYVLDSAGTPFVVVHKECLKTPGRIEEYEPLYRSNKGPFWGTRILVYNAIERELIIRTGVTSPDKVKIVGMPRLDAIHRARLDPVMASAARGVLLISFHKDLNTLDSLPDVATPCLDEIWDSVHLTMFRLAEQRPNVPVTIKTKGAVNDRAWMEDLIRRHALRVDLPNLRIQHGGKIGDLIMESKIVVGVHSTALLEALAANRPVIVPEYAELGRQQNRQHLVDFGETVIRVASEHALMDQMIKSLESTEERRLLDAETAGLLDFWLGNSDGQASVRSAAEICHLLSGPAN